MKVIQLYKLLEDKIPAALSSDWDNDGLMCCPDPEKEVESVLLSLDITSDAVYYAAENKFDVIISHHPLIFKPIKAVTDERIIRLARDGISAMSFHTRLDSIEGGVNDCLAALLGLKNIKNISPDKIGRAGVLNEPVTVEQLVSELRTRLGCKTVKSVRTGRLCHKIALVGGDGKDYFANAVLSGADTYITGSMSYNSMMEACTSGLNIITAGHYYTEQPVLGFLENLLQNISPEIRTHIYNCNLIEEI